MSKIITGNCQKCGAPYYQESPWFGVVPPPIEPLCACWNLSKTYTSTGTTCDFIIESPKDGAEGKE